MNRFNFRKMNVLVLLFFLCPLKIYAQLAQITATEINEYYPR